jgi:hypothetical protein
MFKTSRCSFSILTNWKETQHGLIPLIFLPDTRKAQPLLSLFFMIIKHSDQNARRLRYADTKIRTEQNEAIIASKRKVKE